MKNRDLIRKLISMPMDADVEYITEDHQISKRKSVKSIVSHGDMIIIK